VRLDGTVVDTDSFSFGDRAEQEIGPAVVSIGGRTLIAASSFRNESEHGIYRLAYEVLGDPATGNVWPVAVASVTPAQGDAPLPVSFDASASHDVDGAVVLHEWDFGDGATSTLPSPDHTYDTPANYLAQVTVNDDGGASTTNVERVLVEPVNQTPISLPISNVTSGEPPLSVVFYARDSYDPDQGIQNWEWDFGDGGIYWGSTAYHTFYEPGVWTVTLMVHDFRGATGNGMMTITVGNESPVASVVCSPLGGPAPLDVGFDGSGSSDPDGIIVSYSWSFGDGGTGSGPSPNHVYAATGQYVATLTVTDEGGATAVDQVDVTVIPAPSSSNPVGSVPDRESSTEQPLRLGLELDGSLSLTWGDSCRVTDRDFAVYQGQLGAFSQQTPVACSTGNQTSTTLVPDSGNTFYLVIAHDGAYEGPYGSDSFGNQRVAGPVQCLPKAVAQSCP
jgi:PKD repeat protein